MHATRHRGLAIASLTLKLTSTPHVVWVCCVRRCSGRLLGAVRGPSSALWPDRAFLPPAIFAGRAKAQAVTDAQGCGGSTIGRH